MSLIQGVAAAVRTNVLRLEEQRAVLLAGVEILTAARAALQAATAEARSNDVAASVAGLSAGVEALERAARSVGRALEHIAAYGSAIGFNLGETAGDGRPGSSPQPLTDVLSDRFEDFVPQRDPPEAVRVAGRDLPERSGGRGPTHGWLLDGDLRPIADQPIRSREDPSLTTDLDLRPRERLSRSLTSHVEAHVAALMRRGRIGPEVVLVLNNRVCAGEASCERFLASILPVGTRLAIFVRDGDKPTRLAGIYEGTGERIRTR